MDCGKAADMARIAIVVGHTKTGTLCEALGESYAAGALAGGHEVSLFVTAKMAFDPILHEGFARVQELEPDLEAAREAIRAANHLVLIFPLWLGDMPAILKGFLERVLQPELVEPAKRGKHVKLLKGKSARTVTTMGMPGLVYRWYFRAHAVKMLRRNILGWMGVRPVRSTILGGVEFVGARGRKRWLQQMEGWGRKAF